MTHAPEPPKLALQPARRRRSAWRLTGLLPTTPPPRNPLRPPRPPPALPDQRTPALARRRRVASGSVTPPQSALSWREHDRDSPPRHLPQARDPAALAARSRCLAVPGTPCLTEFLTGAP